MNKEVTTYIANAPEDQQKILKIIRKIIHESGSAIEEDFKWGRPVFRLKKDFAYLKTAKGYVTLGFFDYHKLIDADELLEGTGKDMRHIKIRKVSDIDKKLLKGWFSILTK